MTSSSLQWKTSQAVTLNMNVASQSTVGELPNVDPNLPYDVKMRGVVSILEKHPEFPGVIYQFNGKIRMISRSQVFEHLSRPFGTELFLNRSVSAFLESVPDRTSLLNSDTKIDEAVQWALNRPADLVYEPIVVRYPGGLVRLLDFHLLLLAQSELLANANHFIRQQVETSKALSNILELREVLKKILQFVQQIVPYDHASLLVLEQKIKQDHFIKEPPNGWSPDPLDIQTVNDHLVQTRQPLLFTDFTSSWFWKNEFQGGGIHSWIGFPFAYSERVICILSLSRYLPKSEHQAESSIPPFSPNDLDMIASLSMTFTAAIRNAQLHSELQYLAVTDPLTQVRNRRGFFDRGQQESEALSLQGRTASILLVDIDFFKRVNDTYGHHIGDYVIKAVAYECQRGLREIDIIGRYGGEEFIIFLSDTDTESAKAVAERLRKGIASMQVQTGRGAISVTVSIGIASYTGSSRPFETLVQQADEALYSAKRRGRNRVEVWPVNHSVVNPITETVEGFFMPRLELSPLSLNPILANQGQLDLIVEKVSLLEEEIVDALVSSLEIVKTDLDGHPERSADLTVELCHELGMPKENLLHIYRGARLHDIGKLFIPESILLKPGPLSDAEWVEMRKHPEYGMRWLEKIKFLLPALNIPYCHHEKWDGTGYPRQLKGNEIPLEARVFALVDVYDTLSIDRVYRKAWKQADILGHIQQQAGIHFDPELVPPFLRLIQGGSANEESASGS